MMLMPSPVPRRRKIAGRHLGGPDIDLVDVVVVLC